MDVRRRARGLVRALLRKLPRRIWQVFLYEAARARAAAALTLDAAADAFAWGLAAACARCLQDTPDFDVASARKLREEVVIGPANGG